jgi:serine/threonine protein kinase
MLSMRSRDTDQRSSRIMEQEYNRSHGGGGGGCGDDGRGRREWEGERETDSRWRPVSKGDGHRTFTPHVDRRRDDTDTRRSSSDGGGRHYKSGSRHYSSTRDTHSNRRLDGGSSNCDRNRGDDRYRHRPPDDTGERHRQQDRSNRDRFRSDQDGRFREGEGRLGGDRIHFDGDRHRSNDYRNRDAPHSNSGRRVGGGGSGGGRRGDSTRYFDGHRNDEYRNRDAPHSNSGGGRGDKAKSYHKEHNKKDAAVRSISSSDSSDKDDSVGHFEYVENQVIYERYRIINQAGIGTFGKVLRCHDIIDNVDVCIKVVRSIAKYTEGARIEAKILEHIRDNDPEGKSLCVKMSKWFEWRGHFCMVFERLGSSLYEYIKANDYAGFSIKSIKDFAHQLCTSLAFLHSINLIHTDLKPENILLVDDASHIVVHGSKSRRIPNRNDIKLIDFGGATYDYEHKSSIVNTRQYRAPEVMMELGWSYPSDMWGVGCILMEMYAGDLLFATHDNFEHLALMEKILGPLPEHMTKRIRSSAEIYPFFSSDCKLMTHRLPSKAARWVHDAKPLEKLVNAEHTDLLEFVRMCLRFDPRDRMTAAEALRHKFVA